MVVEDFNLLWPCLCPPEDNAPLVINPDGMPANAIALQCLQTVAGRNGQVRKYNGAVHLEKLSARYAGNSRKTAALLQSEKLFCFRISERLNHDALGCLCLPHLQDVLCLPLHDRKILICLFLSGPFVVVGLDHFDAVIGLHCYLGKVFYDGDTVRMKLLSHPVEDDGEGLAKSQIDRPFKKR